MRELKPLCFVRGDESDAVARSMVPLAFSDRFVKKNADERNGNARNTSFAGPFGPDGVDELPPTVVRRSSQLAQLIPSGCGGP